MSDNALGVTTENNDTGETLLLENNYRRKYLDNDLKKVYHKLTFDNLLSTNVVTTLLSQRIPNFVFRTVTDL